MKIVASKRDIDSAVKRIALQIDSKIPSDRTIVVAIVLDGGLFFGVDLIRALLDVGRKDVEIETISVTSYTGEIQGEIHVQKTPSSDFSDKYVVVVDDINDTGNTITAVTQIVEKNNPEKVLSCTMIERENTNNRSDFNGFYIKDGWMVGYGMDDNNKNRGFNYIYKKN